MKSLVISQAIVAWAAYVSGNEEETETEKRVVNVDLHPRIASKFMERTVPAHEVHSHKTEFADVYRHQMCFKTRYDSKNRVIPEGCLSCVKEERILAVQLMHFPDEEPIPNIAGSEPKELLFDEQLVFYINADIGKPDEAFNHITNQEKFARGLINDCMKFCPGVVPIFQNQCQENYMNNKALTHLKYTEDAEYFRIEAEKMPDDEGMAPDNDTYATKRKRKSKKRRDDDDDDDDDDEDEEEDEFIVDNVNKKRKSNIGKAIPNRRGRKAVKVEEPDFDDDEDMDDDEMEDDDEEMDEEEMARPAKRPRATKAAPKAKGKAVPNPRAKGGKAEVKKEPGTEAQPKRRGRPPKAKAPVPVKQEPKEEPDDGAPTPAAPAIKPRKPRAPRGKKAQVKQEVDATEHPTTQQPVVPELIGTSATVKSEPTFFDTDPEHYRQASFTFDSQHQSVSGSQAPPFTFGSQHQSVSGSQATPFTFGSQHQSVSGSQATPFTFGSQHQSVSGSQATPFTFGSQHQSVSGSQATPFTFGSQHQSASVAQETPFLLGTQYQSVFGAQETPFTAPENTDAKVRKARRPRKKKNEDSMDRTVKSVKPSVKRKRDDPIAEKASPSGLTPSSSQQFPDLHSSEAFASDQHDMQQASGTVDRLQGASQENPSQQSLQDSQWRDAAITNAAYVDPHAQVSDSRNPSTTRKTRTPRKEKIQDIVDQTAESVKRSVKRKRNDPIAEKASPSGSTPSPSQQFPDLHSSEAFASDQHDTQQTSGTVDRLQGVSQENPSQQSLQDSQWRDAATTHAAYVDPHAQVSDSNPSIPYEAHTQQHPSANAYGHDQQSSTQQHPSANVYGHDQQSSTQQHPSANVYGNIQQFPTQGTSHVDQFGAQSQQYQAQGASSAYPYEAQREPYPTQIVHSFPSQSSHNQFAQSRPVHPAFNDYINYYHLLQQPLQNAGAVPGYGSSSADASMNIGHTTHSSAALHPNPDNIQTADQNVLDSHLSGQIRPSMFMGSSHGFNPDGSLNFMEPGGNSWNSGYGYGQGHNQDHASNIDAQDQSDGSHTIDFMNLSGSQSNKDSTNDGSKNSDN